MPEAQFEHTEAPTDEYDPDGHITQTDDPMTAWKKPVEQLEQALAPIPAYVPSEQSAQSEDANDPVSVPNVPVGQFTQLDELGAS